jgi:hypothetical protein
MGGLMAEKMDEVSLSALIASELSASVSYDQTELSKKRADAIDYYYGNLRKFPAMPGRSSATSRDTSDTIGWMLPGIIRVFTASDDFVSFEPRTEADEEGAKQASDYCNYVFWRDNPGYRILYNTTHDSLLHGDGIGKVIWDATVETKTSMHERLDEMQLAQLVSDEDVEILTQEMNEEPDMVMGQDPQTGQMIEQPVQTFNVKIERTTSRGRIRIESIPPEDFLMDSEAVLLEDARFTAHRSDKTRTELLEMGFDSEKVDLLPADGNRVFNEEGLARDSDKIDLQTNTEHSEDRIQLFEVYVKCDMDGDGRSELVKVYYAGAAGAGGILEWEICEDDNPFFILPCKPVPHRWDSRSIADDTMDVQDIKTALIRGVLDNLYASNLPMPDIEEGSIKNMDALINPQFGVPVIRKKGAPPINWQEVPFVAGESLQAIGFFDDVIEKRTGVSRTTMALDPEALQNQTATASNNTKDSAYSQVELIARNHAELGWKTCFEKMLKLVIKYQDRPRTIRLRDKWVTMDPRHWNAEMDVSINVGLGTGSRDRDMAMLNNVLQNQAALALQAKDAGFSDVALTMVEKILNTMRKIAESAGIKNVDSFYPEIGPEQIQALQQQIVQMNQQVDPKVQAEQAKMQAEMEMKGQQFQADVQMRQMDMQMKAQEREAEMQIKREQLQAEMMLKREQLQAELDLKREQMAAELQLKREMGYVGASVKANTASTSQVRMGGEPG